jgi:hypothetical protein
MSTSPRDAEEASKAERAEGVSRQLGGEDPPKDVEQPVGNTEGREGKTAPDDVGESITRSGQDVAGEEGKEAGRHDTGTDDTPAQRPTGTSDARDVTGVDPQGGPGPD